jgi:hypothetical protein
VIVQFKGATSRRTLSLVSTVGFAIFAIFATLDWPLLRASSERFWVNIALKLRRPPSESLIRRAVTAIGTLPSILLAYRHGYVLEPGTESVEEKNRAALGSRPAAAWAERPQAISHSV